MYKTNEDKYYVSKTEMLEKTNSTLLEEEHLKTNTKMMSLTGQ